ncbi:MAG: RNA polymerase sigma factor [Prosthecobacter sp.]
MIRAIPLPCVTVRPPQFMSSTSRRHATTDREFPPTAWTVLLAARDHTAPETQAAREELCRAYWRPLARFMTALGMSETDAQDGAQEVLTQLFARDSLMHLDRERGRMRHYLKAAARHYLFNHRRHASTQKRGGGEAPLSLDELHETQHSAQHAAPDSAFDHAWAVALCDRAMTALEASYTRRRKGELFAALKPTLLFTDEVQRHTELGSLFGVTEAQIRLEVHRLRRRLAGLLRSEVAATLGPQATAAEIEEETRYLVQTLAHEG